MQQLYNNFQKYHTHQHRLYIFIINELLRKTFLLLRLYIPDKLITLTFTTQNFLVQVIFILVWQVMSVKHTKMIPQIPPPDTH